MYKEMLQEKDSRSRPFTGCLMDQGVLPGVKVDEVGSTFVLFWPLLVRLQTELTAMSGRAWKSLQLGQARKRHTRKGWTHSEKLAQSIVGMILSIVLHLQDNDTFAQKSLSKTICAGRVPYLQNGGLH